MKHRGHVSVYMDSVFHLYLYYLKIEQKTKQAEKVTKLFLYCYKRISTFLCTPKPALCSLNFLACSELTNLEHFCKHYRVYPGYNHEIRMIALRWLHEVR